MYSPSVFLEKQNTYKTFGNRKTLRLCKISSLYERSYCGSYQGPVHMVHGAWRVQFLHMEFIRGHKIIWRDKSPSSVASPTCLLSAFDHPWSNCPFPCSLSLSLRLALCLSLFLPGRLPIWKDGKQRPDLHPPICPSGQSLFGKLSTDHVNRGQHVRWWTAVQMSPVETAVVCLLLRVFPCTAGSFVSKCSPSTQGRAAQSYRPWCMHREFFSAFLRILFVLLVYTFVFNAHSSGSIVRKPRAERF